MTFTNKTPVQIIDSTGNTEISAYYVQYDPSDSQPTYIGVNDSADASDDDTDWLIYKFTYDGSNAVIAIKRKVGSWTGRVALF